MSDDEVTQLQEDAKKDAASLTPKCYMPIWIPIESPAEKIQRAKDQFAAASLAIAEAEQGWMVDELILKHNILKMDVAFLE